MSGWTSARGGVVLAGLGMAGLAAGLKVTGVAVFAAGARLIERDWRRRHPEFCGGARERWAEALRFYRETHENRTNRVLHQVGIPLILGGVGGLFLSSPTHRSKLWLASLGAFAAGWAANLVGHAVFERRAPAFSEDALSFVAGPVWDFEQMLKLVRGRRGEQTGIQIVSQENPSASNA